MELVDVQYKKQKRAFIDFIYMVYKDDSAYKDTLMETVKTFLYQKDTFSRQAWTRAVVIVDDNKQTVAQCMYICHPQLPVLQVSFFEALPSQEEAVKRLLDEASTECRRHGLSRAVIGLNGHVRYGVGILCDQFAQPIPFDSLYNKDYYPQYLDRYGCSKSMLTEYSFNVAQIQFSPRVIERVYSRFSFRYLNLKKFKEEMLLFGDLCNKTLSETPMYFDSDPVCLYELMKGMKFFLKPEHLIFVMKDGQEVGFIFWHPDYNEIIPGGQRNGMLGIGFRYWRHRNRIGKFKVNVMGVLDKYKNSGAAIGLLHEVHRLVHRTYSHAESNFVWDSNQDSSKINRRLSEAEARHYAVYDIIV